MIEIDTEAALSIQHAASIAVVRTHLRNPVPDMAGPPQECGSTRDPGRSRQLMTTCLTANAHVNDTRRTRLRVPGGWSRPVAWSRTKCRTNFALRLARRARVDPDFACPPS